MAFLERVYRIYSMFVHTYIVVKERRKKIPACRTKSVFAEPSTFVMLDKLWPFLGLLK